MESSVPFTEAIADPINGYAFFDGVFLKTDSFCDPHWDRVMPILGEEQVFICRQMARRARAHMAHLERPLNILDVGTGSGVFAVYLDRELSPPSVHSPSAILALDLNPRALDMAERNCRLNGSRNVRVLREAQAYSSTSVESESQDLITINPPYHPVPDGKWHTGLALHGASGSDGLAVFREWVKIIPEHLRTGGLLMGSVMSPVRITEGGKYRVLALTELLEPHCFGSDSTVHFCFHLRKEDSPTTEALLRGIYRDHLETATQLERKRNRRESLSPWEENLIERGECLESWIRARRNASDRYAVVYFEVERSTGPGGIHEDIVPLYETEVMRECGHGRPTWEKRIRIHRLMANNIQERPGELPLQSLWSGLSFPFPTTPDFTAHAKLSEFALRGRDIPDTVVHMLEQCTPMRDIRRYVQDSGILDYFDFVLIDPTPIAPAVQTGLLSVNQECAVWSNRYPDRRKELLRNYTRTIRGVQACAAAPFFHPYFVHADELGSLRGYLSSIERDIPRYESRREPSLATTLQQLERRYDGYVANVASGSSPSTVIEVFGDTAYSTAPLSNLAGSQDLAGVKDRARVEWSRFLKQFVRRIEANRVGADVDFFALHWAVHRRLHHETTVALDIGGNDSLSSVYTCVPIQMPGHSDRMPTDIQENVHRPLPTQYLGAFWVYCGTVSREESALDEAWRERLSRLCAYLLSFLGRIYGWAVATKNELLETEGSYAGWLAHEFKDIVQAVRHDYADSAALDSIRAYLQLLTLNEKTFRDLRGVLPAEFARGHTLDEFLGNALKVAARVEQTLVYVTQATPRVITEPVLSKAVSCAEKLLAKGEAQHGPSIRPGFDPRLRDYFCMACITAFRNMLKAMLRERALEDWPAGSIRPKIEEAPACLVLYNPLMRTPPQPTNGWHTEHSLKFLATCYGCNPQLVDLRPADNDRFLTRIPLPSNMFLWSGGERT